MPNPERDSQQERSPSRKKGRKDAPSYAPGYTARGDGPPKMNRAVQPSGGRADGARAQQNVQGNSSAAQRARLLAALRKGPVTTFYARGQLDIMHPGGRCMELRRIGHNIVTVRTREPAPCGRLHSVARYVLMQEALL